MDIYLELCSYLSPSDLARLCCVDRLSKRVVEVYIHQRIVGEVLPTTKLTLYYYFWKLRQLEPRLRITEDEQKLILRRYLLLASVFPSNLHHWWESLADLIHVSHEDLISIYLSHFGDQVVLLEWILENFQQRHVILLDIHRSGTASFIRMVEYLAIHPSELFQNLQTIDLSGNGLKEVPALNCFPKLECLHLADNYLTTIPPWCWKLHRLILDRNPLELTDYRLEATVSMCSLSMEDCGLTQLDWLFQPALAVNITSIYLSDNHLLKVVLNEKFSTKELNLANNRLIHFTGELNFDSLDLSSNDLRYVRVRSADSLIIKNNLHLYHWATELAGEIQLQHIGQRKLTLQEVSDPSELQRVVIDKHQTLDIDSVTFIVVRVE